MKLTSEQKAKILSAIEENATLKAGAKAGGIEVWQLKEEMKSSAIFRKRVNEAREEGKKNIADKALQLIQDYAEGGIYTKTDRNQLTAAIAIANAYEHGFKGTTTVQGRIDHDVRVITAVPRPNYLEEPKKLTIEVSNVDKDKLKELNKGKPVNSIDQAVNEVIEGRL